MNKITNEVLNKWKEDIGKLNIEKGWRSEPRTIEDHCALLHSEVSEAFEDYRNNKEINEVWYEYENGNGCKYGYENKYILLSDDKIILGKPCGIPSELSDVVIRALDMIGYYGWKKKYVDGFYSEITEKEIKRIKDLKFTSFISELHECITLIFQESKDFDNVDFYLENLDWLITACFVISEENGIDLIEQINDKISYNRTRPARHRGKRV